MLFILMGLLAFILFVAYDINDVIFKNNVIRRFFFLGSFLLIFATAGIIIEAFDVIIWNFWWMSIFGMFSLFFLILLIYTLFFALPFNETYIISNGSPQVYRNGVYALCRHPGVLWFGGFYFFLWVALRIPMLLWAGLVFCVCNFLYIVFQDHWTFIRTFEDYNDYKKSTPFIIPNFESIKRCLLTLK
ncbi:MAG: hypothetical protein CVU99_01145 [Firmicutes bacterium HGW-Firmicutes-4]|nr:MAG: hypothetical protein CVU99_01145 [Firmicutes bacterium HGW-Firmicutes-4]